MRRAAAAGVIVVVGGIPVAVTWCPLCSTALACDRRVAGRTLTFGVSGYLYSRNLMLFDRETGSLWSQLLGGAVTGEYRGAGFAACRSRIRRGRRALLELRKLREIEDTVAGVPVVVRYDDDAFSAVAYANGGRLPATFSYWFARRAIHPATAVYRSPDGGDGAVP